MKRRNRVFVMLLAIIMVTTLFAPVRVYGSSRVHSSSGELSEISSYIGSVFYSLFAPIEDAQRRVYLGSMLSSYRVEENDTVVNSDYEVYPILLDNAIIGIANVIRDSGVIYQISCGIDFAPELNRLISKNQNDSFAIIFDQEAVFIEFSTGIFTCIKQYYEPSAEILESTSSKYSVELEYTSLTKAIEIIAIADYSTRALEYNSLSPVTVVPNSSLPCCPGGLCTYASIATMTNYFDGAFRTAESVHNTKWHAGPDYNSDVITWLKS